MINCFLNRYPVNVRFAQYLTDSEKTPEEYFEIGDNDTVGAKFAQAVYNRFYASEIGLEELEIFDLKMKGIFNANIDLFKGIYAARGVFIDGATLGTVEQETTAHGHVLTDETDIQKKDVETVRNENVVYTDVGVNEDTRTREYKVAHTNSGTDTHTRTKTGDADNYKNIVETGSADIFRNFTELFINLFMGVL